MEKSELLKGIENNYVRFLIETITFAQVEKPASQQPFAEAKFGNMVEEFKRAATTDLENDFCVFTSEIAKDCSLYRGINSLAKGEEIIAEVLKNAGDAIKDEKAFLEEYKFFFMCHALTEIAKYCKNEEGTKIVKEITDGINNMKPREEDIATMATFYGFGKLNVDRFVGYQQFKQDAFVYENVDNMKAMIADAEAKFGFESIIPDLRNSVEAKAPKAQKKEGEKKKGFFGFGRK